MVMPLLDEIIEWRHTTIEILTEYNIV